MTLERRIQPMIYLNYRQIPDDSSPPGHHLTEAESVCHSLAAAPRRSQQRTAHDAEAGSARDGRDAALSDGRRAGTRALGERSLGLRLVSSFGAIALLLAAIGIYAMLAYCGDYSGAERLGVRMALGSSRSRVTKLVLRQAGWMVLGRGVIPGLVGAWAAGRAVQAFLFGVKPLDPRSLVTATAILLLTGLFAAWWPARRAASIDPMVALRAE